jgi:hypothetical protein
MFLHHTFQLNLLHVQSKFTHTAHSKSMKNVGMWGIGNKIIGLPKVRIGTFQLAASKQWSVRVYKIYVLERNYDAYIIPDSSTCTNRSIN